MDKDTGICFKGIKASSFGIHSKPISNCFMYAYGVHITYEIYFRLSEKEGDMGGGVVIVY